ncbi:hypothetical protein C8F01DRAFT_135583 [Mycena amicta]|nr:hypothetical protein C8F01DRAFT_135583 [Mycena amicta]
MLTHSERQFYRRSRRYISVQPEATIRRPTCSRQHPCADDPGEVGIRNEVFVSGAGKHAWGRRPVLHRPKSTALAGPVSAATWQTESGLRVLFGYRSLDGELAGCGSMNREALGGGKVIDRAISGMERFCSSTENGLGFLILRVHTQQWARTERRAWVRSRVGLCLRDGDHSLAHPIPALHATPTLLPRLVVDDRPTMFKMVTRLLKYLRPNLAVYHVRSVNLIWSLENATSRAHAESIH